MKLDSLHQLFLSVDSLSTDTRKITSNSMFFAIKGDNFDANTFAAEALAKGASYVVIDNSDYFIDQRTILVEDSLKTLQELSRFHRKYLNIPIVALTGSNGKTTTKELIQVVLSKKYNTKATSGNLNNHIGVPLTLLSFNTSTEIGIVEMGANHQKEIEFLCDIAQPDFGYITNFGKAHLEGFGGIEGVIKGKSEMYTFLKSNDKIAFINLNDAIQNEKSKGIESFTFGLNADQANVKIDGVVANPFVRVSYDNLQIQSHLIGIYNANNINAAIAIGVYFGVENNDIKEALESYIPDNNRSQLLHVDTNQIILDAYNANPSSMAVAITNFEQLDFQNKIMILGDMFELGNESRAEHFKLVEEVQKGKKATCYFVGKAFYEHRFDSDQISFFETFDSFSEFIKSITISNRTILIKGSRGMALERTLDLL